MTPNCNAHMIGKLEYLTFSHEVYGEKFLKGNLLVTRRSSVIDEIPLIVSERLFSSDYSEFTNKTIEVYGSIRSYSSQTEDYPKLLIFLFVNQIEVVPDETRSHNSVQLTGYITKEPVFRTTPMERKITDLLLAVHRDYGKSDYVPVICWGRNAVFVSKCSVGTKITITGRFQSRNYKKKTDDSEVNRITYEISAQTLQEEDNNKKESITND